MIAYDLAASQLLRAIRGRRSQRALARRLQYQGNPVTDWEHGRHFPTAAGTLRMAELCGLHVEDAFRKFHTQPPPEHGDSGWQLAPWLEALRGNITQAELAKRCNCSRFAVRRWLTNEAEPKLPDFLRLLDAMTGRCFDWVANLVPIQQVPCLVDAHEQAEAAKRLAVEQPWTEALLRLLETERYARGVLAEQGLAAALGLPLATVSDLLVRLKKAGIVAKQHGVYRVIGSLNVDTRNVEGGLSRLQSHWEGVAVKRVRAENKVPTDWYAYNQISVSQADLAAVQERLKQAYVDIRAIVAASEPAQEAALVLMHLIHWEVPDAEETPKAKGA